MDVRRSSGQLGEKSRSTHRNRAQRLGNAIKGNLTREPQGVKEIKGLRHAHVPPVVPPAGQEIGRRGPKEHTGTAIEAGRGPAKFFTCKRGGPRRGLVRTNRQGIRLGLHVFAGAGTD
ncbi:hypothetical protein GCM10010331_22480 [Streptomyces xanthochromogenes]|nr:hypothetical protein GCM10010331_22480 [Streptomyces xanthochromogenes]